MKIKDAVVRGRRLAEQSLICAAMIIVCQNVLADTLNAYSQMPTGNTILFPSPFLEPSSLAIYGITREIFDNGNNNWRQVTTFGYQSGAYGFFSSNMASSIAPHGYSVNDLASRFTFNQPIYAVGATLVATNYPNFDNPVDSFDNNYENVSFDVVAYNVHGDVIGATESSSYGNIVGPVDYQSSYRGTELMFSFAGLWLDEPIYQLTIAGRRPALDHAMQATITGFSFSSTPLPVAAPVPEPETYAMMLAGLGLLGVIARRRRRIAFAIGAV